LDWSNISTWNSGFIKTLTIIAPDGTPDDTQNGLTCQPGDKVLGTFWAGKGEFEILENTHLQLRWKGIWLGLTAIRTFRYEGTEDGKTKFTQSEEAKGFMGGVLKVDSWMGGNLEKKFATFNEELKRRCEQNQEYE
jgi:hypothetical protein